MNFFDQNNQTLYSKCNKCREENGGLKPKAGHNVRVKRDVGVALEHYSKNEQRNGKSGHHKSTKKVFLSSKNINGAN